MADPSDQRDVAEKAERIRAQLNGHRKKRPEWLDAMDLVDEPEPEHDWLITDLLERQGRILLAGEEKVGKSLAALTLAVQAAAGIPVLDAFEVELPRRVVYMDLEMSRSSTRRRLRSLSISAKLPRRALYTVLRPNGLNLSDRREQKEILGRLNRIQPELVVIDPLYKLMLTDSLYERDVKPTLMFLDQLRLEFGAGIILVHHTRKRSQGESRRSKDSSDVFGSSVLLRWPELVLLMNEESLRVAGDRDGNLGGIRQFPVRRGGSWPVSLAPPSLMPIEDVFNYIEGFGPCSGNEVWRYIGGRRESVLGSIKQLEAEGRIQRSGSKWAVT